MTLAEALGMRWDDVVALVGGGGKSTAMFRLAGELADKGGGAITVTERGKPLVRLEAVPDARSANPFRARRVRPGYARLKGKLGRGTDSTTMISEDRARPSPS